MKPHDVIVDAEGIAWYSNFGEQTLGRLDPKTGKHTEYPYPSRKRLPTGALSVRFDKEQNFFCGWACMYQRHRRKFDKKTETFQSEHSPRSEQAPIANHMTSPMHIGVDGKVWDTTTIRRRCTASILNPVNGKLDPFKGRPETQHL